MRTYLLRLSIWCVIALLVPGAELAAGSRRGNSRCTVCMDLSSA